MIDDDAELKASGNCIKNGKKSKIGEAKTPQNRIFSQLDFQALNHFAPMILRGYFSKV